MAPQPEVWLRGPIEGIPSLLQPAARALLQTVEDVGNTILDLSTDQIWTGPGGAASVGFHVLHLIGSTDRLLTYARGESLSDAQKSRLIAERNPVRVDAASLMEDLRRTMDSALDQLRATSPAALEQVRTVGRAALPTTVLGLLFHTGEHAQRHAGQIVTTAKIVRANTAQS